jgi:hypothetical protein
MTDTVRCPAAHHDDPTPCDGPAVVTVLDQYNDGADGCAGSAASAGRPRTRRTAGCRLRR